MRHWTRQDRQVACEPVEPALPPQPRILGWPGWNEDDPQEQHDRWEQRRRTWWMRRGRYIVETRQAGTWANLLDLNAAVRLYQELQRDLVAHRGQCQGGCKAANLEADGMGRPVCFRTRRPCPRHRLALILHNMENPMAETPATTNPKPGQLVPAARRTQLLAIEQLRQTTSAELAEAERQGHDVLKGMTLARSMQQLRELLTPDIMQDVMALQNTALGFDTDRPNNQHPQPYGVDVVRDCCITALLSGFQLTGNQWNIISGRFYPALRGCEARVQEWPGLHDLVLDLAVPVTGQAGALVAGTCTFKVDDRAYRVDASQADPNGATAEERIDTRIAVRVNKGMGADAILGKARRKMLWRVLQRLTGITDQDQGQPAVFAVQQANLEAPPNLEPPQPDNLADLVHAAQQLQDDLATVLVDVQTVTATRAAVRQCQRAIEGLGMPEEATQQGCDGAAMIGTEHEAKIKAGRGGHDQDDDETQTPTE